MTDTNHAEVIQKFIAWAKDEAAYAGPGDARVAVEEASKAIAALDALTREAEEARAGWDASEARFDADIEAARADLDAIIIAQAERIAKLEEALEIAKDAMAERRSYVNDGDPSGCWQEMKYGTIWDEEDAQVAAALTPKEEPK